MQHFIIFSPGYNCSKYIKKHMESINNQNYTNYTAIIIDDASTDNTWTEINKYRTDRCQIYRNKKNIKWVANAIQYLIPNIKNNNVIITLDLDDWFIHDDVLSKLNKIYTKEKCWTTYGQYCRLKHFKKKQFHLQAPPYPINIIEKRQFREYTWLWHHLKTFKGFLFNHIDINDLKGPDGNFCLTTWDFAIGFPILEMTPPEKLRYIPEPLIIYNDLNTLRVCNVYKPLVKMLAQYFRNKRKYSILKF